MKLMECIAGDGGLEVQGSAGSRVIHRGDLVDFDEVIMHGPVRGPNGQAVKAAKKGDEDPTRPITIGESVCPAYAHLFRSHGTEEPKPAGRFKARSSDASD